MANIQALPYPIFTEEIPLLKNKKMHVITQASVDTASNCQQYLQVHLQFIDPLFKNTKRVIEAKEAGTLYPNYFFSMYPELSTENIMPILEDLIINANENYLRAESILVVVEKTGDIILFKEVIDKIIKDNEHKVKFARNIYLCQN